MKFLNLTLPTAQDNLACDEVLLDHCEKGFDDEILRLWQPKEHFLVLGYSNKTTTEVNRDRAALDATPILRRCTGGGAVLQGPGCLNYSLILKIPDEGPLAHISETNSAVMQKHRAMLASLFPQTTPVVVRGHSDLTLDNLKFSGNAQRRRRRHLLFHGTFLLDLDVNRIERLLPMPSREPEYRHHRAHKDFLVNLGINAKKIEDALRIGWNAQENLRDIPHEKIAELSRTQYATDDWNFKF